jgi:hypothetical protein
MTVGVLSQSFQSSSRPKRSAVERYDCKGVWVRVIRHAITCVSSARTSSPNPRTIIFLGSARNDG